MTKTYTVHAWCLRPFTTSIDVEADMPQDAIAKARQTPDLLLDAAEECNPVHPYRQRAVLPGFPPSFAIDRDRDDSVLVGHRCAGDRDASLSSAQRSCDWIFLDPRRCRS